MTVLTEEREREKTSAQTSMSMTGELLAKVDPVERMNISLITTDAKDLYHELQKMRYSIEMAFESTQLPLDVEDGKAIPVSRKIFSSFEHNLMFQSTYQCL